MNLHGSYPASTSIESDNRHIRGKLGGTGTDGDPDTGSNLALSSESVLVLGALHPNPDRSVLMPALETLALAAEHVLLRTVRVVQGRRLRRSRDAG